MRPRATLTHQRQERVRTTALHERVRRSGRRASAEAAKTAGRLAACVANWMEYVVFLEVLTIKLLAEKVIRPAVAFAPRMET